MNDEELQRTIDFIVEQEGRSSAKIGALGDKVNALIDVQSRTDEGIRALLAIAEMHEKEIQANTQQILSLAETTRPTDERLNVLINVVEHSIASSDGKP